MLSSISDLLIAGDERIELLFLCPEPPVFSTFLDKIKWLQLVTVQVLSAPVQVDVCGSNSQSSNTSEWSQQTYARAVA